MIQIYPNLTSNSQEAFTLEDLKKFGERKENKIIYSIYEALFLVESKKAKFKGKKPKLNKDMQNNYLVFKDLRKKGFIPKTGLKFGAEFRIYEKNKPHAAYLTLISSSKQKINWKEFIIKNRITHSTGKKLLIAIIDSQQDITYFCSDWIKLGKKIN